MSIVDDLPGTDQLQPLLDDLFKGVDSPKIDINVDGLKNELLGSVGDVSTDGLALPALPALPSKDGFIDTLSQPLNKLTALNGDALLSQVKGALPLNLDAPTFDVNSVMSRITEAMLPVETPPATVDIPGFDADEFLQPLRKLAEAGAATPTRLLTILLALIKSFVDTVTDPDKLIEFTVAALQEIVQSQLQTVHYTLPVAATGEAAAALQNNYLDQYENLLNTIDGLKGADFADVQKAFDTANAYALTPLRAFRHTNATLTALKNNSTDDLTKALDQVLRFSAAEEVFIQPYLDLAEKNLKTVLEAILEPVNALKDMAVKIEDFLKTAAGKAEDAAKSVSDTLETSIGKVDDFLQEAEAKIQEIAAQIEALVGKVDVGPVIKTVKDGFSKVGDGVESFFTKVEELKQKLDDAVKQVSDQVDDKMKAAFDALEKKIRELLAMITDVLKRPEVKQALDQAKQGIEQFKKILDEASLQPVFDLVINKTGDLENSIKAIDVSRLGTPQKMALKVGAKIIQEVKVDEIIKPELMAAFEQIREPLRELIALLRDKVLVVEQTIDEFNPGTLATDAILQAEPYQTIISTLESFKPSVLLAPLKDANAELTKIVEKLDPQIIIDQVQKVYDQLYEVVEALAPDSLNQMITDITNTVIFQLEQVRDFELDKIVNTIKETISLAKLLEGVGLQDLAEADFWQMLKDVLGGGYLDAVNQAVKDVGEKLDDLSGGLDFSATTAKTQALIKEVNAQITAKAPGFGASVADLKTLLEANKDRALQLEARRKRMAADKDHYPEVRALLADLDLTPLTDLSEAVAAVAAMEQKALTDALKAVKTVLNANKTALQGLEKTLREGVPLIFEKQFANPIRGFITTIQTALEPFKDAIEAIQNILRTLAEIPTQIDAAVGGVLDTLRSNIKQALGSAITTIKTFREALAKTIQTLYDKVKDIVEAFNPVWLLNSFAESDFAGDGTPPAGMVAMAKRIASPGDDTLAALLRAQLTDGELTVLRNGTDPLSEGSRTNLLKALNRGLRQDLTDYFEPAKNALETQAQALEAALEKEPTTEEEKTARIETLKQSYRNRAATTQLNKARSLYDGAGIKDTPRLRLNRLILEAHYPEDITLSLQSLHPYIVEQVATLYPEATVQRLDALYAHIIETLKTLPDRMIREPLDEAFNEVKTTLLDTFDIKGIFTVLDLKIEGMDKDLSLGLDRLSAAYNRVLTTLDQRLAA